MKPVFVYPGTFCPPTYGHLAIVRKAAKLFPRDVLNIVCSFNPGKKTTCFQIKNALLCGEGMTCQKMQQSGLLESSWKKKKTDRQ